MKQYQNINQAMIYQFMLFLPLHVQLSIAMDCYFHLKSLQVLKFAWQTEVKRSRKTPERHAD